jgi:hypothetical protein
MSKHLIYFGLDNFFILPIEYFVTLSCKNSSLNFMKKKVYKFVFNLVM